MRCLAIIFIHFIFLTTLYSQVLPGTPVSGFPKATTSEITALNPPEAFIAFSTDEKIFYYYDGTNWNPLISSPTIYVGSFIINAPGGSTTTSFTTQVTGLPFKPSQVTFITHANIESFGLNDPGSAGTNTNTLQNAFGTSHGYARDDGNPTPTQGTIFVGGSGSSINSISRYSSNSQCIGVRFSNNNANNLGVISGVLNTFDFDSVTSTGGFSFNITYTIGTTGNNNRNDDVLNENLVVFYTAYR